MGCWNGTCGLTSLPILEGDAMYVFPIKEAFRDSFCYSTALYKPSLIPFRADYNDYGGGENCGGVGLDILMAGIKSQLVEMEIGDNQYHDIAVKREGFNAEVFFEACHEKRLKFDNVMRGYQPEKPYSDIYFTMIRKDVADRLWKEWKFDIYKSDGVVIPEGFATDDYYVKDVTYERLAALIPEYLAQCGERFHKDTSYEPVQEAVYKAMENEIDVAKIEAAQLYLLRHKMERFFVQEYDERDNLLSGIFGHMFGADYADGGFTKFAAVNVVMVKEYLTGDKEKAYEIARECLLGYMVNSFMEHTRKVWIPVMHQCSQSQAFDEYSLLTNIMTDVINDYKAEYSYNEEDE